MKVIEHMGNTKMAITHSSNTARIRWNGIEYVLCASNEGPRGVD